jgi:hypothetical protein
LASFFGTWGFSKPAEDEALFSAILVVKGTRVGTGTYQVGIRLEK